MGKHPTERDIVFKINKMSFPWSNGMFSNINANTFLTMK